MNYPVVLDQLIEELAKLPGIGRKTAKRLAFFLLSRPNEDVQALAESITQAKKHIHHCSLCFGFSEEETCDICNDPRREPNVVCIVEEARNIFTIEGSGIYKGMYHVLQGAISPLQGIGPDQLRIRELEYRVETSSIREVILATNPTIEGEATAHYLTECLIGKVEVISRIARGMPAGSDMEFADASTLARAFEGRTTFT